LLISTNFTLVVKEVKKAKSRRGGKAKKADEATEALADTTTDAAE
jgi:large subunit ribosomal protein L17